LYVLFSLLLIANTVSEVANSIADRIWEVHEENIQHAHGRIRSLVSKEDAESAGMASRAVTTLEEDQVAFGSILQNKVPPLPWKALRQKLAGWLFFVALGVAFYANYPGEDKTVFQSIYFSIITLSTVGCGAFTALTPGGKAFGAFWMLFGSFSLLGLVGAFTEMMCVLRSREKWRMQKENVHEDDLFKGLPDQIDIQAFMEFTVEYTSLVQREDVETILNTFEDLRKVNGKGTITKDEALALYDH